MYALGLFAKDSVHPLTGVPQSSVGAPCPMVVADEHHLSVIFYLQNTPEGWDGAEVKVVGPDSEDETHAIVSFSSFKAYYHGAPNDEAFSGHPLSKKGLEPYGAYEVKDSTWIRDLIEMNRVHAYHSDEAFKDYRHFIFSFHDTTFECVAKGYDITVGQGSVLGAAQGLLHNRA